MWSLGITAALEVIKEALAIYRDKTDPVKNRKRVLLELKKQLVYQEKQLARSESRLKKALSGLDEKDDAVQYWTLYRYETTKEIKRIKMRIKMFEKR